MLIMVMVIWIITLKCMTVMMKLEVVIVERKNDKINHRDLMDQEDDDDLIL